MPTSAHVVNKSVNQPYFVHASYTKNRARRRRMVGQAEMSNETLYCPFKDAHVSAFRGISSSFFSFFPTLLFLPLFLFLSSLFSPLFSSSFCFSFYLPLLCSGMKQTLCLHFSSAIFGASARWRKQLICGCLASFFFLFLLFVGLCNLFWLVGCVRKKVIALVCGIKDFHFQIRLNSVILGCFEFLNYLFVRLNWKECYLFDVDNEEDYHSCFFFLIFFLYIEIGNCNHGRLTRLTLYAQDFIRV